MSRCLWFPCLFAWGALGACSSGATHAASTGAAQSSSSVGGATSSSTGTGGDKSSGAGGDTGNDGGDGDASDAAMDTGPSDGTPTRDACTSNFGNAVTSVHGRLDGLLVAIVPPESSSQCNADTGHVHLQVQVSGSVYDVAVNTDTLYDVITAPLPTEPWTEGWHPDLALDYPTTLDVHDTAFTTSTASGIAQLIETDLATANHISVYATGYGPTGIHDVHREGTGKDGAIVIEPLSNQPRWLLFRFTTDSF